MSSSRREFFKHAAILSGSLALPSCKTIGQGDSPEGSYLKVSPINGNIPRRVSWTKLSTEDKKAFIEAVKSMKLSQLTMPASFGDGQERKIDHWTAQAEVHQFYCSHRNSLFLPWHRSYLYQFEKCLRKQIRDSFRLPYWDWTLDQNIPIELQDSQLLKALNISRSASTLAIPGKAGALNTKQWWESAFIEVSKTADYDTIGGDADSSGLLESPYHNMVHVGVGGDMGRVPVAARDPVFWLHHCNIDRLWSLWMDRIIDSGNTRRLFPSTEVAAWLNHSFPNHFVTSNGALESATVKSSLFTEELGYNYETMKKTWTLADIPPDQLVVEQPAPVETVSMPSIRSSPVDAPDSFLQVNFTLAPKLFSNPQRLLSLRLKVFGIPQPDDSRLSFAASIVIGEKTFALPEIGFFPGAHDSDNKGMIGLSINEHMNSIRSLAQTNRGGQLLLSLKDSNDRAVSIRTAIPNLNSSPASYTIVWKAVFA